ncbi:L,D-transpeptidase family protein [Clostridium sp. P21]|uniref:L,D-transpeptidase family protein n=1 Tax=Clostridium muellerianum TaxID=2716538 RepID=A0A7Y0HMQ9_9CLOT|nr:L,D-transpeptidase family protein [Clostridium muellerianum]NMM63194.1 L,D-transpeptidase family protein [Clostridium muellerianum]
MSKFKKLLIILLLILIVEIIIIYAGYKSSSNRNAFNVDKLKSSYVILADVSSNNLTIFKDGTTFKVYQIAGGKPSTPSPLGTWKIVSKDTWGDGFGGYWMGFNVPWGKYGIHGTLHPGSIGWNSSHGCIRMRNSDVKELYKIIPYGTTVIIWGGPYGSFGDHLRVLKPGMIGADVYQLQIMLQSRGYYKSKPNGIYNDYFKYSVHKFQKDNSIPVSDTISSAFYSKLNIHLMD